ncbi:Imm30 family immunity protein [Pseudomonas sp. Au-Pse12]|uniref:Imm30 family immunity protein n=1 Tax=Pseudomonas sp. Au-Pse12 TaxID=2906459 RepID=UPI001E65CBB4|nr:Imm30 family immunity protein [Pseudomonas sp. Au-Pse12]MCE4052380.1 immunity 30 family protein [Pseudomonas sp. Au-Pse12]
MKSDALTDTLLKLENAFNDSGEDAVRRIDACIAEVAQLADPASIGPLLSLLDDEAEYDVVMYSLIHAAEHFDDPVYVPALLAALPGLLENSPRWAQILFTRVLNSEPARLEMVRALREAAAGVKAAALELANSINQQSPAFLAKTMVILVAAQPAA